MAENKRKDAPKEESKTSEERKVETKETDSPKAVSKEDATPKEESAEELAERRRNVKYPKQVWIDGAYDMVQLPKYVVAAALENAEEEELSLVEVKRKIYNEDH